MEKRQWIVFDRIWVCVLSKQVLTMLTGFVVALHQTLNETNKTKRWLLSSTLRRRDRWYLVGDQLQMEVRHWLSPPDPSTNHNFVSRARHSGTASWFFESKALTEWKSRGSLLWIHGKRTSL